MSIVQIRSYVHPLCDIWAAPRRRVFLLRSYPHKPNRARRAQSAHALNCGYVPNRGDGARWRICYQWPKATMRRQGRRETPACEVYPNRRRAFWAPLTAPWSGQGQAREAGTVRAPRTLRVRGVGSRARVSPAAPAMPGTYSVCVAAPYALFFASLRFI